MNDRHDVTKFSRSTTHAQALHAIFVVPMHVLIFSGLVGGGGLRAATVQGLCPAGSPFNLRPTLRQFAAGQPGIPLLHRIIDPATYPEARCNDGSPAVMYIRPATADYAGNPITQESSKWVIFLDGGAGSREADDRLLTRSCSGGSAPYDRRRRLRSRRSNRF